MSAEFEDRRTCPIMFWSIAHIVAAKLRRRSRKPTSTANPKFPPVLSCRISNHWIRISRRMSMHMTMHMFHSHVLFRAAIRKDATVSGSRDGGRGCLQYYIDHGRAPFLKEKNCRVPQNQEKTFGEQERKAFFWQIRCEERAIII